MKHTVKIYALLTGGGVNRIVYLEDNSQTVLNSSLSQAFSVSFYLLREEDPKKTIHIPFVFSSKEFAPHQFSLDIHVSEKADYDKMELRRVTEIINSEKKDLIMKEPLRSFVGNSDQTMHAQSFPISVSFDVTEMNRDCIQSWRTYEIEGVIYRTSGVKEDFTHTINVSMVKKDATVISWRYLADSYTPPSWPGKN